MDDISTLERFNAQDLKRKVAGDVTPTQLKELMEFNYIRLIMLLPQSRFASIRDKYAWCMMSACIAVFNSHVRNRSYAKTWMENAELLAVSPEVKTKIANKLSEMESIAIPEPGRGVTNSTSTSGTGVIKLVFFILLAFIKIATCNSWSSSRSSYDFQSLPKYKIDQHLVDSLINSYKDTAQVKKVATDTPTFTYKIKRHSKHK